MKIYLIVIDNKIANNSCIKYLKYICYPNREHIATTTGKLWCFNAPIHKIRIFFFVLNGEQWFDLNLLKNGSNMSL